MDLIVAMAKNKVIGKNGTLPWHLPSDLKYFKEITKNSIILMGRRTLESLPFKLPTRIHWYMTNNDNYEPKICGEDVIKVTFDQIKEYAINPQGYLARKLNPEGKKVFCIGGATLFEELYPYCERLYITEIEQEVEGDTYLNMDLNDFVEESCSDIYHENGFTFCFKVYKHK